MILLLSSYIAWHYGRAYRELVRNGGNIIWFIFNFFSVSVLLRTLFSPWQRLEEQSRGGILDIEEKLGTLVINLLMRIVGFVIRSVFIVAGLVATALAVLGLIIVIIVWTVYPALIVILLITGLKLAFS